MINTIPLPDKGKNLSLNGKKFITIRKKFFYYGI